MDGPRGSMVVALLLVIAGFLGYESGEPLFALIGVGCLLLAPVVLISELVGQFREGHREAVRERAKASPADPVKRRP